MVKKVKMHLDKIPVLLLKKKRYAKKLQQKFDICMYWHRYLQHWHQLNAIQDRGSKMAFPYNFSPLTSTYVGINPWNVLTFSFNNFATIK